MNQTLDQQAEVFGRYLIGEYPSAAAKKLYIDAITHNPGKLDDIDQTLLRFVTKKPWALGLIDASLPFYKPESEVRRRLYVLLAILEATPQYHDKFLPTDRGLGYIFYLAYCGIRAIFRTVVGSLLVRIVA